MIPLTLAKKTSHKDVFIVVSAWSDVVLIAGRMRQSDRDEIMASDGASPIEGLERGIDTSRLCHTVVFKGVPIAMFGVVPAEDGSGSLWLLGTDELDNLATCFGRTSRKIIRQLLEVYPHLFNYVDARNQKTIDWLTWCGAEFSEAKPYGVEKRMFKRFDFKKKVTANV
jgi:hypothetical protein